MDSDLVTEFIKKTKEKRELEERLNSVKKEIKHIEEPLMNEFEKAGCKSINMGDYLVGLQRRVFGNKKLESNELGELLLQDVNLKKDVSYSPQGLTAFCRELEENGEPLPSILNGKFELAETFKLYARKKES